MVQKNLTIVGGPTIGLYEYSVGNLPASIEMLVEDGARYVTTLKVERIAGGVLYGPVAVGGKENVSFRGTYSPETGQGKFQFSWPE